MASPYTGGYAGITKGEKAEAGKMTAALNLLERVANKTDTVTADSTAAQYPSAAAAYTAIAALSGAGLEITDNKVTSATWGANDNKNSDVKYPSCRALEAAWNAAVISGDIELVANKSRGIIDILQVTGDKCYPAVQAVRDELWQKFKMYRIFTARK
ncbi:hypothetical protein NO2_1480 [Candidatus Termititenax persephonae]|uniref:Uncharacterized protein n=1 Tax=Candidatus Termititenax persephonae TaxID=2218525 RepID=A0A388TII4_9BACT|nr:hypothetical protein NO2_1480 [Candidatus Termititenax persephonae]